ncbi:MAG: hypothetical protein QM669_02890 [Siphonobacter sp.]
MKYIFLLLFLLSSINGQGQFMRTRGYTNYTELGILFGKEKVGETNPSQSRAVATVQSFNGYRLYTGLVVGATVGIDWYNSEKMIVPLSIGFRGDFSKKHRVTPYYALDIGKGMMWLTNGDRYTTQKGGFHLGTALGLRITTGNGTALLWSIGYKRQAIEQYIDYGYGQGLTYDSKYKSISMRLGISF